MCYKMSSSPQDFRLFFFLLLLLKGITIKNGWLLLNILRLYNLLHWIMMTGASISLLSAAINNLMNIWKVIHSSPPSHCFFFAKFWIFCVFILATIWHHKTRGGSQEKCLLPWQTAAVLVSAFPVIEKKQVAEHGRRKASRADMKKAEERASEEERADVREEEEKKSHGKSLKIFRTLVWQGEEKNWQASFLSLPLFASCDVQSATFWAPAV